MIEQTAEEKKLARKYRFINARIMADQMIDEGADISLSIWKGHKWEVVFLNSNSDCVVLRSVFDERDYDRLVLAYSAWCNGR